MKTNRRVRLLLACVALAVGTLSGCQTWVAGMTLPSPRYLEHTPQYFPPSPSFPLNREMASMELQAAGPAGAPLLPGDAPRDVIPPPP